MRTYKPLGNRIVVEVEEEPTVSPGGIALLPPVEEPRQSLGTVIAVGPGRRHKKTGKLIPTTIRVGERVAFSRYGHHPAPGDPKVRVFHEESVHYVLDV